MQREVAAGACRSAPDRGVVCSAIEPRDSAAERALRARFADRTAELIRRLEAQPEVARVTFADHFPGLEGNAAIEVERVVAPATDTTPAPAFVETHTSRVAIDLFEFFNVPILAGRGFVPADAREGATSVIVSASLAERVAGGAGVLGRRIRYAERGDNATAGPWLEVVGVVSDFAHNYTPTCCGPPEPRLFHAAAAGDAHPATLVVRIGRGEAATFAVRLRDIAAAIDPTLTLDNLETVTAAWEHEQQANAAFGLIFIAVMLSVLLLSAAGIYAMMSFTVAKRRREIGIRAALGADPRRILTSIFARAAAQLGAGVLGGVVIAAAFVMDGLVILPGVAALMIIVGLLAALGPARRGLAVQPTEALREE
jgi:hypothetical protein